MTPDRDLLRRSAAETGFGFVVLEKVARLGELAANIARHALLGKVLALKGGTALNLSFDTPRRLSVDLDFNYVGATDRKDMLRERPAVERALMQLGRRLGYRVQRSADAFAGRKLFMHYRSLSATPDRIEIDLNFLLRVPLAPLATRFLWQPGPMERPHVVCVSVAEIATGKLCALLDRCAARDVWDVAHLPPEAAATLCNPGFRARFLVLAGTMPCSPGVFALRSLAAQLSQAALDHDLLPLLSDPAPTSVACLTRLAWQRVAPLMRLAPDESLFINALAAGEVRTDLLFPADAAEARRLAQHPALLWKALNAADHRHGALAPRHGKKRG